MVYVIMGVSGAGKSTIGELLADGLGCHFYDGDDFHPPANIQKMEQGIPLTDQDREPWLESLRGLIENYIAQGRQAVVACSCLRAHYRQQLGVGSAGVQFIFLQGEMDLIKSRMKRRKNHFMPSDLLKSQFAVLEPPEDAIVVNVDQTPEEIVSTLIDQLSLPETG